MLERRLKGSTDDAATFLTIGVGLVLVLPFVVVGLSLADSVTAESSAFLTAIDREAPDYAVRHPIAVSFTEVASLYGAPNLVA